MTAHHYELVVIGSGPAGQKGAIAAAKLGKQVAIVDREAMIGGVCLNTGTIPSKTLREAILYLTGIRQRAFYGQDYTLKPNVSISDLASRVEQVRQREKEVINEQLSRNRVARNRALDQRPELKQARLKMKQAEIDNRVKKAEHIPDISLSFQHIATANFNTFIPKSYMNVGITVTWEVFDWGRKKHELAEKGLVVEQARNSVREAESSVRIDVNDKFNKLRQARQLLRVTQLGRESAIENVRVLTNRYKVQMTLLRDVLQAQTQLEQANDQSRGALLGFWTAKAEFDCAIGEDK
jgi:outer membrane protein TolC